MTKKPHIMIDARVCNGKMHGIARVAESIIKHLVTPYSPYRFTLLCNNNYLINNLTLCASTRILNVFSHPYSLNEQWELPRIINREKPDLFYSTTFTIPLYKSSPAILTIFDLIPMRFPESFPLKYKIYYRWFVKRFCRSADHIIVSSKNTLSDIVDLYHIDLQKITVVYCANSINTEQPVLKQDDKYILYIGNTKPHKNFIRAIKAFDIFRKKYQDKKIILKTVGITANFFNQSEIKDIPQVKIIEDVSDEYLRTLLCNAQTLFFPSLYEGFGLPPIEAMSCGIPVVSSNCSAVPEVLGNAYCTVDPYNIDNMANGLYSVMTDISFRQTLIKKGYEQARKYSWNHSTASINSLFRRILDNKV